MMIHKYPAIATAIIIGLVADHAVAQIGFSVTQRNGVVEGGSLVVGGFLTNGGTGVRMGISANTNQLIGIQNFTFQNGIAQANGGNNNQVRRAPTRQEMANQFVLAAGRFDADNSSTLDKEELTKVAAAVLAEMKQQSGQSAKADQPPTAQKESPIDSKDSEQPTEEEMIDSFVERSLKYDRNKDEALNARETQRMAMAFLRSLN